MLDESPGLKLNSDWPAWCVCFHSDRAVTASYHTCRAVNKSSEGLAATDNTVPIFHKKRMNQ